MNMDEMYHEAKTRISPELLQAFEETHYQVHHTPSFTLHIGQPCLELDALLKASGQDAAAFLTAWNPVAQPLGAEENRTRQLGLVDELKRRSLRCIDGIGQHPSNGWSGEESVLVLGLQVEAARALCVQFGQLACVAYRREDVARLLITDCSDPLRPEAT
jgi:hypothetical protein